MATGHDAAMARAIVRALVDALDHDPSARVRLEAARNLGLAAPSREEAQGPMSRQIIRHAGLGQSAPGNEDAVDALVRAAAGDPRHNVRDAACESLQNVAAAVPGLLALLRSAPPPGRVGAAKALAVRGRAGRPAGRARNARHPRSGAGGRRPPTDRPGPVPPAPQAGRDPLDRPAGPRPAGPGCRGPPPRSLRGLTHAGPAAAPLAGELAGCLGSEHESLHGHALEALAGIGPEAGAALPAVMALIRSPSISVQLLALRAAWAINGDRPPHLDEMLDALMKRCARPRSSQPDRCDAATRCDRRRPGTRSSAAQVGHGHADRRPFRPRQQCPRRGRPDAAGHREHRAGD